MRRKSADSLILCSIPCGCVSIMVFVWTVGRLKWYTNNENIMIRIITLSTGECHQDFSFPESDLKMRLTLIYIVFIYIELYCFKKSFENPLQAIMAPYQHLELFKMFFENRKTITRKEKRKKKKKGLCWLVNP